MTDHQRLLVALLSATDSTAADLTSMRLLESTAVAVLGANKPARVR